MPEGDQDAEGCLLGEEPTESTSDDGVTRIKAATGFSCFNCRDQKRYCDKAYPCGRCKKLGLECIMQTRGRGRPSKRSRPQASGSPPPPKGRTPFPEPLGQGTYTGGFGDGDVPPWRGSNPSMLDTPMATYANYYHQGPPAHASGGRSLPPPSNPPSTARVDRAVASSEAFLSDAMFETMIGPSAPQPPYQRQPPLQGGAREGSGCTVGGPLGSTAGGPTYPPALGAAYSGSSGSTSYASFSSYSTEWSHSTTSSSSPPTSFLGPSSAPPAPPPPSKPSAVPVASAATLPFLRLPCRPNELLALAFKAPPLSTSSSSSSTPSTSPPTQSQVSSSAPAPASLSTTRAPLTASTLVLAPPVPDMCYKTGMAKEEGPKQTAVVSVDRPIDLAPGKELSLAYDTWCDGLAQLRINDDIDPNKAAFVWQSVEFLFRTNKARFAHPGWLQLLGDVARDADKSVVAVHKPSKGVEWVNELFNSPGAACISCWISRAELDAMEQVRTNDLMDTMFISSQEVLAVARQLGSILPPILARLMSKKSVEEFFSLMARCSARNVTNNESNCVLELRDRRGERVRCLTTMRWAWSLDEWNKTVLVTLRFWPLDAAMASHLPPTAPPPTTHNPSPTAMPTSPLSPSPTATAPPPSPPAVDPMYPHPFQRPQQPYPNPSPYPQAQQSRPSWPSQAPPSQPPSVACSQPLPSPYLLPPAPAQPPSYYPPTAPRCYAPSLSRPSLPLATYPQQMAPQPAQMPQPYRCVDPNTTAPSSWPSSGYVSMDPSQAYTPPPPQSQQHQQYYQQIASAAMGAHSAMGGYQQWGGDASRAHHSPQQQQQQPPLNGPLNGPRTAPQQARQPQPQPQLGGAYAAQPQPQAQAHAQAQMVAGYENENESELAFMISAFAAAEQGSEHSGIFPDQVTSI